MKIYDVTVPLSCGLVQARPLDRAARYRVALPEFLLTGGEVNRAFVELPGESSDPHLPQSR